jgi:hypothetical protein
MTTFEEELQTARDIIDKLEIHELEFIRSAIDGGTEGTAFREIYNDDVGVWKKKPEPLFTLTEEDAQIAANDMIGRELTPEEMRIVKKGVENGLDDWSIVMATAVRYAAGGD